MAKKKDKPEKSVFKVFRIIKNVLFGIILAALVCLLSITLTARINGETPSLFGHAVYRVSSGSMVPYLEVGDIILCKEVDPMTLQEGDVVTYNGKSGEFAGKRVTHRVITEPYLSENDGRYYIITKGDDNPVQDTPVELSQVTGKMIGKLDWVKQIYNFFLTPWGLLTIIGLIILAFFNEIINFAKALFGFGEEEEHEDIQDVIDRIQREDAEKRRIEKENEAEDKTNE